MKEIYLSFFLLFIIHGCNISATLSENNSLDLYLLVGQSNMAGRGYIEKEDTMIHSRVFVFNEKDSFVYAKEPLHYDKKNRGVGPGLEFGKRMAIAYPGSTIGLIPAAVGGTKISYWKPDDESELFKEAVRKTKVAMINGNLKGIIWQQGESDSHNLYDVEKYKNDLIELINSFRNELGDVPVVLGGLGNFLKSSYASEINEILKEIASTMKNVRYSDASKLGHIGDNLHFNTLAQRENGKNMALEMINIHNESE